MLERFFFAYSSGLFAAISPCVIVLIPLCMVRFIEKEHADDQLPTTDALTTSKKHPSNGQSLQLQLMLFLLGFQFSYIVFGFLLSELLTSSVQDGVKLGLGSLFLIGSILGWQERMDPMKLPLFHSPFATGISFALLLSFNPCTVPFLALIISISDPTSTLLSLLAFGQGLITPSLMFVWLGKRLMRRLEGTAFQLEKIKPFTYAILGLSGLYLLFSPIYTMNTGDVIVGMLAIAATTLLIHQAAAKFYEQSHESTAAPSFFDAPPAHSHSTAASNHVPSAMASSSTQPTVAIHSRPPIVETKRFNSFRIALSISFIVLVLFLSLSFMWDHNEFTHSTIDNMYANAQKQKESTPTPIIPPHYDVTLSNDKLAVVASQQPQTASGKFEKLRRQLLLNSTNVGSASISSIEHSHTDSELEHEQHHLDQDALDVPTIDESEHQHQEEETAHATHSHAEKETPPQQQLTEGSKNGIDLHAIEELLAAERAAAAQPETADADEDSANCIDFSMVPPCFQCQSLLYFYRTAILLIALLALWYDRLHFALHDYENAANACGSHRS